MDITTITMRTACWRQCPVRRSKLQPRTEISRQARWRAHRERAFWCLAAGCASAV